jgi:hypothetical protein
VATQRLADGTFDNAYGVSTPLKGDAPDGPWAMYLADSRRNYWFLAFDFDTKYGAAERDARRLNRILDTVGIENLIVRSQPDQTSGFHVWVGMSEPAPAETVRTLAALAKQIFPSLDTAPLMNPATGCVRPPGAPHRRGGYSTVDTADLTVLADPATTLANLDQFHDWLVDAGAAIAVPPVGPVKNVDMDSGGRAYLVGPRRAVSTRIQQLLTDPPENDTSVTAARVLSGYAWARQRFADVLPIAETAPAFEHYRSRPLPDGTRAPRPRDQFLRHLAAEWDRQVLYVAANPVGSDGSDPLFAERAGIVAERIRTVQDHADAMPGRWGSDAVSAQARTQRGRPVDRLVLDAVCMFMCLAAQEAVEVDTRRLAAVTGYGRESCRQALLRLCTPDVDGDTESSWLVKTDAAAGVHGARFRLGERLSTGTITPEWAQVTTRPSGTPLSLRTWWITELGTRLQNLAADVFAAPGSLGRTAGRVYAAATGDCTVQDLVSSTGLSAASVRRGLRRLHSVRLTRRSTAGWERVEPADLSAVARALGCDGYLSARDERYGHERGVWAWWQAEHLWMKRKRRRRPDGFTPPLFDVVSVKQYPRYPRHRNKRADHATARLLVAGGTLSAQMLTAA